MTQIQSISPDEQNVVELSESPGRRLRVLRQSKGWEIERVATQLHLRPRLVEAMEQDRYDELPGPVFVMGYLRNYARLLGLDAEPLIGAYRAAHPNLDPILEAPPRRPTASPRREIGSGHILVRLVSLGLLVAVAGLLVLWWQNRPEPLPEPSLGLDSPGLPLLSNDGDLGSGLTLDESPAPETAPYPVATDAQSESATPMEAPAIGPGSAPAATASTVLDLPSGPAATSRAESATAPVPRIEAQAQETSSPAGAAIPPAQAIRPGVTLRFTGTSWIDVRDSAGKVILTGEMRKGDQRDVDGDPPLSFVIGNAAAAVIRVGDRTIDLSTRGRGGVARFKLDPSKPE